MGWKANNPSILTNWWGQEGFGKDIMRVQGHCTFAGADSGDLYYNGAAAATQPLQTAAAAVEVVSDSVADDAGSTGALTVKVTGLDGDYLLVDETFTTDGTTPVEGTQLFLRVLKTDVMTAGTGGVNAGNISVRNLAGAITYDYIAAGRGVSMPGRLTVPAGKTLWLSMFEFTSNAITAQEFVIQKRRYGGAWHYWIDRHAYFGGVVGGYYPVETAIHVPAKCDIQAFAQLGGAASVTVDMFGVLTDD